MQVMGALPICFDGMHGIVSWCPSKPADTLYIVISKAVIGDVVSALTGEDGNKVSHFLEEKLKRHPDFNMPIADNKDLFMEIMCRTPLKVTSKNRKSDQVWMKENLARYIIVDGSYWRGLLEKIDRVCIGRPTQLTNDTKSKAIPERRMVHRFSIPMSKKQVEEYDSDATFTYKNMENKVLGYDELSVMPAMNIVWWDEAYSGGCHEFFNMEAVDGVFGHVQSGMYVEPSGNVYARGYKDTVAIISANILSQDKTDERTKSRAKRRRASDC